MSGFNSIHTAAAFNGYVREKVAKEVQRLRPGPRTARVVEILDSHCMVTYSGENTVVKVPFNNLAPSHVGQVVVIDGPMGDRRIVEVIGQTSFDTRIQASEDFRFSPPLWLESLMEYPETVPAFFCTATANASNSNTLVSPMIAPRATSVARVETRIQETSTAILKMSLYRVGAGFSLSHVQTENVPANNLSPGFNLTSPLMLNRNDVVAIAVGRASGTAETLLRIVSQQPAIPTSREGQFMLMNLAAQYQGNDVSADLFGLMTNGAAVYGVCLPSTDAA